MEWVFKHFYKRVGDILHDNGLFEDEKIQKIWDFYDFVASVEAEQENEPKLCKWRRCLKPGGHGAWQCSSCCTLVAAPTPYCPECGKKMDLKIPKN